MGLDSVELIIEIENFFGISIPDPQAAQIYTIQNSNREKGVSSYNFNMGLGYRIYLNNSLYLGLKARYNIVDYRLSNVVDFTGNAFTFQLIIGGLSSPYSSDLRRMGYRRK